MAHRSPLSVTIRTSLALVEQFITSLSAPRSQQALVQPLSQSSPLHLLSASATTLKSTVTKVSLLTITAPFTPSVVASTLQSLNTSILPNLVTAALLVSPSTYPTAFVDECTILCRAALRNLVVLITQTKQRAEDEEPTKAMREVDKNVITGITGKVWEDCDRLVEFAQGDITLLVCKKAEQWLELMRDAVKEFQDWDPEEEVGSDPFGFDDTQSNADIQVEKGTEDHTNQVAMSAGVKDQALKVLSRIPQSVHVVVKQRLAKIPKETLSGPASPARNRVLDAILDNTKAISGCIDESAEAMYMGDLEMCLKKAGEARALTIDVVEAVLRPWNESNVEGKEDIYVRRALAWIRQVETDVASDKQR